jgi:uncharacterized protein DUF6880
VWVRKNGRRKNNLRFGPDDTTPQPDCARLEAKVLEKLGENSAAQVLRWRCFENSLNVDVLHDYLRALADFEDVDALDNAFAHALKHKQPQAALQFFLAWPRLDHAARLIVENFRSWSGADYYTLPKVAETLEHEYPLASTILYRALLDDILTRARSKAYRYGAKYLKQLETLAAESDAGPERPPEILTHKEYYEKLKQNHARKSGFWAQVAQTG